MSMRQKRDISSRYRVPERMRTDTRQREDGRIELLLPLSSQDVMLNNKRLALIRLNCLTRKLKGDKTYAVK